MSIPRYELDLQDSKQMNDDQQALFLNISRSRSSDSFLGKLLPHPSDVPDRSLVWDVPFATTNRHSNFLMVPEGEKEKEREEKEVRVFRKIRKEKVRGRCDYQKNICGYITKKVIREFVGTTYSAQVDHLMHKYQCTRQQCKSYYLRRVQQVTGPSHLPSLFLTTPDQSLSIGNCKRAFHQFYHWFLRQRYIRHLLLQGKMTNKQAYIQYKNKHLFRYSQEEVPGMMVTRSRSGRRKEVKQESQDQDEE